MASINPGRKMPNYSGYTSGEKGPTITRREMLKRATLGLTGLLLLPGCSPSPAEAPTPLSQSATTRPTETALPSASPTLKPTETETATPTNISPAPTETPVPIATATVKPTVAPVNEVPPTSEIALKWVNHQDFYKVNKFIHINSSQFPEIREFVRNNGKINPVKDEVRGLKIREASFTRVDNAGSYIALDPDSVQMIMQAVRKTITIPPAGGQMPVLLTAIDVRRYIRKLIEGEYPDLAVLSFQEIVPEIRIQPLGRIQIK